MVEDFQKIKKELAELKKKKFKKIEILKGKLTKKAKATPIKSVSPTKLLTRKLKAQEEPSRNLYFNQEMMEEARWLS